MVAHLIRLRFLLLGNMLRRSPWQLVATILGGLYGLGILFGVMVGLIVLGFAPLELARTLTTLGGAVLIVGWIVLPLVAAGIDQTVDPARLSPFPIPLNTLLVGLTASGVLGVPGLITSIAALTTVATWWHSPVAAVAALICAVIGVLTCVVGSRMVVAVISGRGTGRRAREAKRLLIFIPLILLGPILIGVSSLVRFTATIWPGVATVVSWTPLGAVWSVPADVAAGAWGPAVLKLLIGLATLALVAWLWRRALARALQTPARESSGGGGHKGLGLFGVFPGTPTGAIAARALTYWMRDPRYAQSLIVVPLVPVLLAFYSGINHNPGIVIAAGPITAVLLGMSIFTDVSYDSTAFALHLQKSVRGVADRLGRVIALAAFSLPVTVIFTVGSVWYLHDWAVLPGMLGLSLGALISAYGLSSAISARWAFAVPAPGENPFRARPGGGFSLALTTWATWGILIVLTSPEFVLTIVGGITGRPLFEWLSLVVGLVLGAVFLTIGVRVGGATMDRRGPELLVQLQRQK